MNIDLIIPFNHGALTGSVVEAISGWMTGPGSAMEPRGVANGVIAGEGADRPGGGAY